MTLELRVVEVDDTFPGVRSLVLAAPDGAELPSYAPGSHVYLGCGTRQNAYSLTGEGVFPTSYHVSVHHRVDGRGGSTWLHRQLCRGDLVGVSAPRSSFAPVANARHSLYVAGGIGVTALSSHVRDALRWSKPFELVYVSRGPDAPHLAELKRLCGQRLRHLQGRFAATQYLRGALRQQPVGTYLYTCGPTAMINNVNALAGCAGWPAERIRSERFVGAELTAGAAFDVRLTRSGKLVHVAAGVTLLDALLGSGADVASLCRQGVCGECRTPVRSGRLEHHDYVLTEDEHRAGRDIMCCVSRAVGLLELDL
jgi:dimethylamine monooxygenase subunit B